MIIIFSENIKLFPILLYISKYNKIYLYSIFKNLLNVKVFKDLLKYTLYN